MSDPLDRMTFEEAWQRAKGWWPNDELQQYHYVRSLMYEGRITDDPGEEPWPW